MRHPKYILIYGNRPLTTSHLYETTKNLCVCWSLQYLVIPCLTIFLGILIDIMINSLTHDLNPLMRDHYTNLHNEFAVRCLHMLRADDFSKAHREQIMQRWEVPELVVLGLEFLALKVKIMQHPAIYEGMSFQDLVKLADILSRADEIADDNLPIYHIRNEEIPEDRGKHLTLLKELTRLIFS